MSAFRPGYSVEQFAIFRRKFEFKVFQPKKGEVALEDIVHSALKQIKEKQCAAFLIAKWIPADRIRTYGFAFEGKEVLIGTV